MTHKYDFIGEYVTNGIIEEVYISDKMLRVKPNALSDFFLDEEVEATQFMSNAQLLKVYCTTSLTLTIFLSSQSDFKKHLKYSTSLNQGWNYVYFHSSFYVSINGEVWKGIRYRRLRANGEIILHSIQSELEGTPQVVLSCDDGKTSQYTEIFKYCNKKGIVGAINVISDRVGQSNYVTLDNLKEMYKAGWDICNHTKGEYENLGDAYTAGGEKEVIRQIKLCRDFIKYNGFVRDEMYNYLTYPQGLHNDVIIDIFKKLGGLGARTILDGIEHQLNDKYRIRRCTVKKTTTLEKLKSYVDTAIDCKGTALINFHEILDVPVNDTDCATHTFRAFIDYLADQNIQKITFTQYCNNIQK